MPMRNTTFTKSFVRRPGAGQGDTSIPIRTEAPPPLRQPTKMQRSKTLTRPERGQPQVPLINPQQAAGVKEPGSPTWRIFSKVVTFWAVSPCMSLCGMKDRQTQQAWREKVALVSIALFMGGIVGFITMGMNRVLCPASSQASASSLDEIGKTSGYLGIGGWEFNATSALLPSTSEVGVDLYTLASELSGIDITGYFNRTVSANYPACADNTADYATSTSCLSTTGSETKCPLGYLNSTNLSDLKLYNSTRKVGFTWDTLANSTFADYLVVEGNVLNFASYLDAYPDAISGDSVDTVIRRQLQNVSVSGGKDATKLFYSSAEAKAALPCLLEKYYVGHIDKVTPGCFVADLFLYASLITILSLVFVRFFMAIWFSWFISAKMSAPPKETPEDIARRAALNQLPNGAVKSVNTSGAAPWAGKEHLPPVRRGRVIADSASSTPSLNTLTAQAIGNEPWIISLVTCYSEGEEGISTTLSSLAESDYPDHKKLIFVVADGMVTGHGEAHSTPDVCVGLLESDTRFGTPMPMSFISVAQGKKAHNMAMVYVGHYVKAKGHRVPMIVVVKCGPPDEAGEGKPGNRGKRDSQMILMNFLQRVTYNDRMTPLDFDLFRKVHALTGVTPDFFELILMVDADTKVFPAGMRRLSNAMMRDHAIMGACGETRIANKTESWVTAIQVFEYFISHHLVKSFESVFGGVTCLPGCFSMYRIKARKPADDDWVPIIVKPEVTREYSQSTVQTLHQKNLLLLGEDRFLTTLLLRTFPNRKMVFVPQARCRTEVPHTFKMLLSQRRRWINSTIHNLMELVLVRDLCGTFCFSMQFVVFMDLVGTMVLPVAICLTYILIVSYCLNPPKTFAQSIPLILLIAVIGLPAILILLATRKIVYTLWMLVYLVFLPVWNFILPVYAFWHFDDFSWGETRKVEGETKGDGHGDSSGVFAAASVPLRRWEDWERSRLRKQKREEKRRKEMESQFGGQFWNDQGSEEDGPAGGRNRAGVGVGGFSSSPHGHIGGFVPLSDSRRGSESFSDDAEEDVWGAQIGTYQENAPPPTQVFRHTMLVEDGEDVLRTGELEAMLDKEEGTISLTPSNKRSSGILNERTGQGRNTPTGVDKSSPVKGQQPLAPSRAQARRSVRFSKLVDQGRGGPMLGPNGLAANGAPIGQPWQQPQYNSTRGPGSGPGGPGGRSYPNGPSHMDFDRTPSPSGGYGEDVSLMRNMQPLPSPSFAPNASATSLFDGPTMGFGNNGVRSPSYQLQDFGPASKGGPLAQQGTGGARAMTTSVNRNPFEQSVGMGPNPAGGPNGSPAGHARQRSGGNGRDIGDSRVGGPNSMGPGPGPGAGPGAGPGRGGYPSRGGRGGGPPLASQRGRGGGYAGYGSGPTGRPF